MKNKKLLEKYRMVCKTKGMTDDYYADGTGYCSECRNRFAVIIISEGDD